MSKAGKPLKQRWLACRGNSPTVYPDNIHRYSGTHKGLRQVHLFPFMEM